MLFVRKMNFHQVSVNSTIYATKRAFKKVHSPTNGYYIFFVLDLNQKQSRTALTKRNTARNKV